MLKPGVQGTEVILDAVGIAFRGRARRVCALANVSFRAKPSEIVAVLGPSGSGKTTLLNVIAGLVAPTNGAATVDGLDPAEYRRQRGLGFCFQEPVLFDWRTVLENIMLPAEVRGADRLSATASARALLDRVGLSAVETADPRELSGGMKQRVSLCRALLLNPELLLLDEPFSAVDALTRQALWVDLQVLRETTKPTTFLVTHSVEEAAFLADRVIVLSPSPGNVVACIEVGLGARTGETLMTDAFHKVTVELRRALAQP